MQKSVSNDDRRNFMKNAFFERSAELYATRKAIASADLNENSQSRFRTSEVEIHVQLVP